MDTLLEHLLKEWKVILQAPFAFGLCVVVAAIIIFFALEWLHRERVATKEERIKLLSERLDESRLSLQTATQAAAKSLAETSLLKLHFYGDERTPTRLTDENVWRWFFLRTIAVSLDKDTWQAFQQNFMATLFISFDIPVSVGTLEVGSPDMQLPMYEVKEFNNRFAIITFRGGLPQGTLQIEVHR
jgi:hypothetical protein